MIVFPNIYIHTLALIFSYNFYSLFIHDDVLTLIVQAWKVQRLKWAILLVAAHLSPPYFWSYSFKLFLYFPCFVSHFTTPHSLLPLTDSAANYYLSPTLLFLPQIRPSLSPSTPPAKCAPLKCKGVCPRLQATQNRSSSLVTHEPACHQLPKKPCLWTP